MKTNKLFFMAMLVILGGIAKVKAQGVTGTSQTTYYFSNARSAGSYNSNFGFNAGSDSSHGNNNANVSIGHSAGSNNDSGSENTFVGYYSGLSNLSGTSNVFVGSQAGQSNGFTPGMINPQLPNGTYNVFVGAKSGFTNDIGGNNAFFGYYSGFGNSSGSHNTFLGRSAGYGNSTGGGNTYVGTSAGRNSTGSFNSYFGNGAGYWSTGSNNIYLGVETGLGVSGSSSGSGNIFIGNNVGGESSTFSNQSNTLLIDNENIADPLIMGDFATEDLTFNINATNASRVTIKAANATAAAGISGLKFPTLTNAYVPTTSATKFLTVNNAGDVILANGANDDWHTTGNDNISPIFFGGYATTGNSTIVAQLAAINSSGFIGTRSTSVADVVFRRGSAFSGMIGSVNTAFGNGVMGATANGAIMTGINNAAFGAGAASNITEGNDNVAFGHQAISNLRRNGNTIGSHNTAIGSRAGSRNIAGDRNIFIGSNSGNNNVNTIESNKLYIDNISTIDSFIKGDLDTNTRGLILNLVAGNNSYNNNDSKLIINSIGATPAAGISGLRFADMNNTAPAIANPLHRVLSVNDNAAGGDVILVNDRSLYDEDGTLAGNRTVTMGNNNLIFNSTTTQTQNGGRIYIGNQTAFTPTNFATTNGNYKLFVEGGVLTEKAKVALSGTGNWSDYVFANDYKLMPLKEIESFVKENKHLPGIESAEELVKNGLDLGDMQAKQMGKIEELTLYAIEQEKKLEKQGKEIEELKAQIKVLIDRK
jgi:hypothetical protein